jgi:hypothetical protein
MTVLNLNPADNVRLFQQCQTSLEICANGPMEYVPCCESQAAPFRPLRLLGPGEADTFRIRE